MNPAKRDSFPDEEDGYEQEENEDNTGKKTAASRHQVGGEGTN